MNRRRILAAIRFPVFMLAWTAGVVLMTAHYLQPSDPMPLANAASSPLWERPPGRELPTVADPAAWSRAMAQLSRHSEVMNGSWQPPARSLPRIHPVATVAPADGPADAPAAPDVAEAADIERSRDVDPAVSVEPAVAARASVDPPGVGPSAADDRVVKTPVARFAGFGSDKSRARDALRDGRFSEAYALLRPQVSEGRHDSEYLGLLALAAMRLGGHGEAMVLYQRLAALEPASSRWRMGLALAQEGLGLDPSSEYRLALALADDADGVRALLAGRLADADVT
jgi:hypothetical protein